MKRISSIPVQYRNEVVHAELCQWPLTSATGRTNPPQYIFTYIFQTKQLFMSIKDMLLVQHSYPLISLTLKLDLSDHHMNSNLLAFPFIAMVVAWLAQEPLEEHYLKSYGGTVSSQVILSQSPEL